MTLLAITAELLIVGTACGATYLITKQRVITQLTTAYADERDDLDATAVHNQRVWTDLCDWRDELQAWEHQLEARDRAQRPRSRFDAQPSPLLALHGKPVDWTAVEAALNDGMFEAIPFYEQTVAAHPEIHLTNPDNPNPWDDGGAPKPKRVLRKYKRAMAKAGSR